MTVVSGVRAGEGKAFGSRIGVTGVSPDISKVITVDWQAGSQATPGELGQQRRLRLEGLREERSTCSSGSTVLVETPTGQTMNLDIRGIFAPPKGGSPYGDVTISTQRFDREYQNPQNVYAFVDINGGVTPANTAEADEGADILPRREDRRPRASSRRTRSRGSTRC